MLWSRDEMAAGRRRAAQLWSWCLPAVLAAGAAAAQVPPDIASQNRALGTRTDVPAAVKTYAPVEEQSPYPASEARITRDISYGDNPHYKLDIFAPAGPSNQLLPVIIHAGGGAFTRKIDQPGGAPFYDNVMLWAAKHGLVGVNPERRPLAEATWEYGPEDMKAIIGWVHAHIAEYGGDPDRIVFLGHAYGSTQVVSYLAHPEYWCCGGPGIIGATVISAPLNLLPATSGPAAPSGQPRRVVRGNPVLDPGHSDLQGLSNIRIPIFIGATQFEAAQEQQSEQALRQRLCALGRCPTFRVFADHNHLSAVFSFNTSDSSVSGSVLDWIRSIPHRSGSQLTSN